MGAFKINYVIAGATRAGSTSLHEYLGRHSEVFVPSTKELWFFNVNDRYGQGIEFYKNYYRHANPSQILAESTPCYWEYGRTYKSRTEFAYNEDQDAIARIHKHFPKIKVIISLRDPVERIKSIYLKNLKQGKLDNQQLSEIILYEIENPCRHMKNALLARSRYDLYVENLLKVFPKNNIRFVVFEEWSKNVIPCLQELAHFVGIKDVEWFAGKDYSKTNENNLYHPSKRNWLKRRRLTKAISAFEQEWPEVKDLLKNELESSVRRLEQILEREFSEWCL